ncbi:hypothetical protein [Streptomyces sp. NPDC020917]|uniref:Rv1733c family protein n=1 Tax=Streptomyces sp. NPDC020917 TaxID=3365102 RepID=UPI0037A8C0D1
MRTTVRFWRWRRNPLKRGTDRAEAWSAALLSVMLFAGAPAAGVATGLGVAAAASDPPAGWHTTAAVQTQKAPPAPTGFGYADGLPGVRSPVRWTTSDGHTHTGQALVSPGSPAGSRVTVWLDRTGSLRDNPVDPTLVRARGVAYGTCAATATALLAGGAWAGTRRYLDRRRAADLDREWARIGPQWGTAARG